MAGRFCRHVPSIRDDAAKIVDSEVVLCDASELSYLADGSVDAIVTDPPYGINKMLTAEELLTLYRSFIGETFRILNPKYAQIVISTASESKTGRSVLAVAKARSIIQLIMVEASRKGFDFTFSSKSWPGDFLNSPYYWRSERGVDRSILHFSLTRIRLLNP